LAVVVAVIVGDRAAWFCCRDTSLNLLRPRLSKNRDRYLVLETETTNDHLLSMAGEVMERDDGYLDH
jgi:hypothetical protein